MHRLTLGDFELTAVSDGIYRLDGGAFFGVVPKVMWEKKVKANAENYVPVGLNSVVVRTGQHTVLIETGIGNKLPERLIKIFGQPAMLLDNLAVAGISPEDDRHRHQHPPAFRSLRLEHDAARAAKSCPRFRRRNTTRPKANGNTGAFNSSATRSATCPTTTIR